MAIDLQTIQSRIPTKLRNEQMEEQNMFPKSKASFCSGDKSIVFRHLHHVGTQQQLGKSKLNPTMKSMSVVMALSLWTSLNWIQHPNPNQLEQLHHHQQISMKAFWPHLTRLTNRGLNVSIPT